ncbi:MAG: DUF4157 domain-containing protein [Caldilineaceae bacterium]
MTSPVAAAPPVVHDAAASGGQPMDAGTRRFMERRFGRDFGAVRIHTDRAYGPPSTLARTPSAATLSSPRAGTARTRRPDAPCSRTN